MMRPRKLSKSIKSKSSHSSNPSSDSQDFTFKTSIEELFSSTSRQSLRQNFIEAFPETQLRPSLESIPDSDMRGRDGPIRTTSSTASGCETTGISSSSSTSVNSAEAKRLPTVRESNAKIDIGDVITLLQELRVTASPAELVALHKALLPTRDSVMYSTGTPPSLEDVSSSVAPSQFVRRRSLLPPGVATRSVSAGLLKKREESVKTPNNPRPHTEPTSKNDIVALDLADEHSFATKLRAPSPIDHANMHMGAFRPGTLRIMNGTASPEPNVLCRSVEAGHRPSPEQKVVEPFETAPSTPNDDDPFKVTHNTLLSVVHYESESRCEPNGQRLGLQSSQSPASKHNFSLSELRRASEPVMLPSPISDEPELLHRRMSRPTYAEEVCSLRDQRQELEAPLHVGSSPAERFSTSDTQSSLRTSTVTLRHSLDPTRQSVDDGKAQPNAIRSMFPNDQQTTSDIPRFAQRWSHRLSHISQDTSTDSRRPSDPGGDHALRDLSTRLSTVTDKTVKIKDEQEVGALESPDIALATLNGHPGYRMFNQSKTTATASKQCSGPSAERDYGGTKRPSQPEKIDSGYGSDISRLLSEQRDAKEAGKVFDADINDAKEQTHKAYESLSIDDDEISLYSIGQILKAPSLLSGLATPSPPCARGSDKHLSLLGLTKAERSNSLQTQICNHNDLTGQPNTLPQPEQKPGKLQKKLQKPRRLSIRRDFKNRTKAEERRSKVAIFPFVPDDLEDAFLGYYDVEPLTNMSAGTSTFNRPQQLQADMPREMARKNPLVEKAGYPMERVPPSTVESYNRHSRNGSKESESDIVGATSTRTRAQERGEYRGRSGHPTQKAPFFDNESKSPLKQSSVGVQKSYIDVETSLPSTSHPRAVFSAASPLNNDAHRIADGPVAKPHQNRTLNEPSSTLARSKVSKLLDMQGETASERAWLRNTEVVDLNDENLLEHRSPAMKSSTLEGVEPLTGIGSPIAARKTSSQQALGRTSVTISKPDGRAEKPFNGNVQCDLATQRSSGPERPGDSTESIADAIKKAVQARKEHGTRQTNESQNSSTSHCREAGGSKSVNTTRQIQSRKPGSWTVEGANIKALDAAEIERPQQRAPPDSSRGSSMSPSTVNPRAAQKPLFMGTETTNTKYEPLTSAKLHEYAYGDLSGTANQKATNGGIGWKDSAATFVTVLQGNDEDSAQDTRTDSAYSAKSCYTGPSLFERSSSPDGCETTSPQNFYPSTRTDVERTAHSRAKSLARLTGTDSL